MLSLLKAVEIPGNAILDINGKLGNWEIGGKPRVEFQAHGRFSLSFPYLADRASIMTEMRTGFSDLFRELNLENTCDQTSDVGNSCGTQRVCWES